MIDVKDLIGKPYTKEHDCNWLAAIVALRAGKGFPKDLVTPEDEAMWAQKFRDVLAKHYTKVTVPKEGDLAIFEVPYPRGGTGWHCGTIVKPGVMVTTRESVGVHLAKLTSVMWRVCIKGYYEYNA